MEFESAGSTDYESAVSVKRATTYCLAAIGKYRGKAYEAGSEGKIPLVLAPSRCDQASG